MNARIIGLGLVFVAFAIFTAEALVEFGLFGFLGALNANMATQQVFVDLVIALSIVIFFVARDARERGLPWLPYVGVTLLLGSIGPLAYLIHRELASRPQVTNAARSNHARAV